MTARRSTIWALLLLVVGSMACQTSESTSPRVQIPADSPLMGLDERPQTRIWRDWTPSSGPVVPDAWLRGVTGFDYWQIDDEEVVESAWTTVAIMLDAARREVEDESMRHTATALLEALEGGPSEVSVDVTFVVRSDSRRSEGVVLRMARRVAEQGTPVLALALMRGEDDSPRPARMILWTRAGFEEPTPFTMEIARESAEQWTMSVHPTETTGAGETTSDQTEQASLIARVVTDQIWMELTGAQYAGAETRADDPASLPNPLDEALGLQIRDRRIDELFSNSAFTPRMDSFEVP